MSRSSNSGELNTKVYSIREWKSTLEANDVFVTDVLPKPKIFLIGDEDELAELGRRKSLIDRALVAERTASACWRNPPC